MVSSKRTLSLFDVANMLQVEPFHQIFSEFFCFRARNLLSIREKNFENVLVARSRVVGACGYPLPSLTYRDFAEKVRVAIYFILSDLTKTLCMHNKWQISLNHSESGGYVTRSRSVSYRLNERSILQSSGNQRFT